MQNSMRAMTTAHIFMTGQSGVGQSLMAGLFGDWISQKGLKPVGFDLCGGPGAGLSRYTALPAHTSRTEAAFHGLEDSIERKIGPHVVDVSSRLHVPLLSHMLIRDWPLRSKSAGRQIYLHAVIAGGASYGKSVDDAERLAGLFPELPLVLWVNEYHSPATTQIEEVHFFESMSFEKLSARAIGFVRMKPLTLRQRAVLASLESLHKLPSEIQAMESLSSVTRATHAGWAQPVFQALDGIFAELPLPLPIAA